MCNALNIIVLKKERDPDFKNCIDSEKQTKRRSMDTETSSKVYSKKFRVEGKKCIHYSKKQNAKLGVKKCPKVEIVIRQKMTS